MAKEKQININDFQLSMWSNTTHVGLGKLKFSPMAKDYVEKAIREIFRQHEEAKEKNEKVQPVAGVPYSLFPEIRKALEQYNKKHATDFLVLYYKHAPVGIIKEDKPVSIPVCPECGIMVKKQDVAPVYSLWEKIVRIFFRNAYEKSPGVVYICQAHGKFDQVEFTTI